MIDIHCHIAIPAATDLIRVVAPDALRSMGQGNPLSAETQRRNVAAIQLPLTDVRARLEIMDRTGIAIQVLSPSPGHYYYSAPAEYAAEAHQLVNNSIAEAVASHPKRFVGMGVAPLQDPKLAVGVLQHYPKLKICVAHGGGYLPAYIGRMEPTM